MMLDSKYFPGHPSLGPQPPYSPTFGRKDIFNQRKQREFIPENKKDDSYWDRRRRNNEAAKRSREKRRLNDMLLETRVLELSKDNHILQAQLNAIYDKYGIKGENMISMDQVLATLPSNDQVLNFTKKRLGSMSSCLSPGPSSPISFQSLSLPLNIHNNNNSNNNNNNTISGGLNSSSSNNNNNSSSSSNNNSMTGGRSRSPVSHSPERSYRSPSPPQYNPNPVQAHPYTDLRSYAETGLMYRRGGGGVGTFSQSHHHHPYEDEHNDDKDSGLALNLSTDRAGSDGRSSGSGSPPVPTSSTGGGEREGSSSGDESGYPRSPNSGESSLPHKLRFKSAVNEKEAVNSLLSLRQIAMIKREPAEHINHWMERMESSGVGGVGGAVGGAGSGGVVPGPNFFASLLPLRPDSEAAAVSANQDCGEPLTKRLRQPPPPEALTDEVARLTSEVNTLKNILVNRMKNGGDEERDD